MTDNAAASMTPAIYVHGAWQGEIGDPERVFRGNVTDSRHPEIAAHAQVEVRYQTTEQRQPDAAEHGTYELRAQGPQGKTVKLLSFTCRSEATAGKHGTDDTQPADWQAVTMPD